MLRGVTYGPFRPDDAGCEYHRERAASDFAQMAQHGINAVRLYTQPPEWLLDLALAHGLRVQVGLAWEQHIAFLRRATRRAILARAGEQVRACRAHPAILAISLGNEIPSGVVRWFGARAMERFLGEMTSVVREADPHALVTYVNYPTTEYLQLPFLDFLSMNVFLESNEKLRAYLPRLQNIAGDRPLVISELGLDSMRRGEARQAELLGEQIRTCFAAGCAGTFVFSWTDEWYRGGAEIEDWAFGLTTRERAPKAALAAVEKAYADAPYPKARPEAPRISVVVCTYNGSRTLRGCLDAVARLEYPNFETIVVDDGSRDGAGDIARGYNVRVIRTENGGLSRARNIGMRAATGEIVAYLDDDAEPPPHWLCHLAHAFMTTTHAAVGGPNVPPPDDGDKAFCVANSPGGPIHVLVTDELAEHLPGCNLAIRKKSLEAIGGFDEQFRIAGDDVDVCWRLEERGWTLGFAAGAMVWHRRRNSVRAYWNQQLNYGKAEGMLELKWPDKYNALGHLTWHGRLYQPLTGRLPLRRWRVYHGVWGSSLFQSVYAPAKHGLMSYLQMPEWYLLTLTLGIAAGVGYLWRPLVWLAVPAGLALLASVMAAVMAAMSVSFRSRDWTREQASQMRLLLVWLHLIQPLARLIGRTRTGLTPWRNRGTDGWTWPWPREITIWHQGGWKAPEQWLGELEQGLNETGAAVVRGDAFAQWDLAVRAGFSGTSRISMMIEEHGQGMQLVRLRVAMAPARRVRALVFGLAGAALVAVSLQAVTLAAVLGGTALVAFARTTRRLIAAHATALKVVRAQAAMAKAQPSAPVAASRSEKVNGEKVSVPMAAPTRSPAVAAGVAGRAHEADPEASPSHRSIHETASRQVAVPLAGHPGSMPAAVARAQV